jgi:hypothetical protein
MSWFDAGFADPDVISLGVCVGIDMTAVWGSITRSRCLVGKLHVLRRFVSDCLPVKRFDDG